MKKETKRESFIYEGLGFPIRLINVPMKKIFGEWAIDVNFSTLQTVVLSMLAKKHTELTGGELRFIMGYFEMSTRRFAALFNVTHVAVLKWLNENVRMNPNTEMCLRLYILDSLKVSDSEFKKLYLDIRKKKSVSSATPSNPLEVDIEKIAC